MLVSGDPLASLRAGGVDLHEPNSVGRLSREHPATVREHYFQDLAAGVDVLRCVTAETMPREKLRALQLRRLKQTLKNAWDNVPLHRKRMKEKGVTPADIRSLENLAELGFEVFPRGQQTPEVLGALVKADSTKWWPLIKEFGIKAE